MIIGVTGPIASGKNEIVNKLIKKGFINLRVSDSLKELAKKQGIPLEREPLQNLGNELRKKYGAGYLAEQLTLKIEPGKRYVVDSIRNPGEVETLKKLKDFVLIGFNAPYEKRIEFLLARKKAGDPLDKDEIKAIEERDRGKGEDAHGQRVDDCFEMAHHKIINEGSLEELNKKVENLLLNLKI